MKRAWLWAWPLVVTALALAATAWLWTHERDNQDRRLRDTLEAELRETATRVGQRLHGYEQVLRGTRGLFEASNMVTRQDFARYVEVQLGDDEPTGLRSIVYAPRLTAAQLPAHVAAQRAGGVPGYSVRPPGGRELHAPVTYVAPERSRPIDVRGLDVYADPVRREAMERARDSGRVAISERIHLASLPQTKPEPGFLMFMPLYAAGRALDSVAARREALTGWVFATFRIDELMTGLFDEGPVGVDLRVHDRDVVDVSTRLHPAAEAPPAPPARFEAREYVAYAGHTWTLVARSRPAFEQRHRSGSARIIAVAGGGLSLLLGLLTWQLATSRERAQEAARAMTQQLREGAERYRRIVETANEGIWTIDAGGRTSFVNPKLARMLGYEPSEMLSQPQSLFLHDEGELARQADADDAGQTPGHEHRFRRRDGSDLWGAVSVSRIAGADGAPAGLLAMVTDVTERRASDANRALLEKQLLQSQKMEAVGTLAGGIAHDFNNILAAILGNVALARQEIGPDEPAQRRLEQIGQAGARARSLVQQIVAFSRQQPQQLRVQPLQPLIEETLTLLRSTLPPLVELEPRLEPRPLMVAADGTQLQQVLMNLCTNAWHALQRGRGRIVVGVDTVTLDADDAQRLGAPASGIHAHLWVQDDGCGMDESVRSRLFDPFFTTKPVGQGTGLGLAVVHGIVVAHHGAIRVDSEPGRGSTFHVYLPLAEPRSEGGDTVPDILPSPDGQAQGQGRRVLYVDDDAVMVTMVEALLRRAGWQVHCTADPQQALQLLRDAGTTWDVVVTDFNMPELSGLDLARRIRRLRPGLPVLMTSGYVSDALRDEARRIGIAGVLQKEYTLERLGPALEAALTRPGAEEVGRDG